MIFEDNVEKSAARWRILERAHAEEILLVTLAHIIFLLHFRSILIVTLPLPVSVLISFILMREFGITSNIMSLSGIAIAIGVLVAGTIVLTETIIRHCEKAEADKARRIGSGSAGDPPVVSVVLTTASEVAHASLSQTVASRDDDRAGALHLAGARPLPLGGSENASTPPRD